ncbi:MAG: hypothetical protein EPO32_03910 [Anaerolineae bacterium]|nr:MAG: hypothetical protein EPO32_03910 [Anaerolineae bacterium]
MKSRLPSFLLLTCLALAYFLPRVYRIGQYVNPDEPAWLESSAAFYTALREGDWAATYRWAHPGVTTMWAGTFGILAQFPDFYEQTRERENFHFDRHLNEFGFNHLQLLAASRLFILAEHTAIFLGIALALRRLLGTAAAALGAAFIALDPFLFAHSRFLHAETFLPDLLFLAFLLYLLYLKDYRWRDVLLSGGVFAFSLLSKSPALLLLPALGLLSLLRMRQTRQSDAPLLFQDWLKANALWGLAALVVFVALWPAMWVQPLASLQKMAAYIFESSAGQHTSTMFYNGQVIPDGDLGFRFPWFYPVTFLWRTTPVVLVGLLLAFVALFGLNRVDRDVWLKRALLWFPLLFMLFLLPTAKKFDRYAIPIYPPLDVLAALGWLWAGNWLRQRWPALRARALPLVVYGFLIAAQALPVILHAPYYLSYYNPWLGGGPAALDVMMVGWGEGLDEAARYLNSQPGASKLNVAAWYAQSFNYHFDGYAVTIPIQFSVGGVPGWLLQQDYLVTYVAQWQRQASWPLLTYLEGFEPDYVVVIDGIEYVRIYNPRTMTPRP